MPRAPKANPPERGNECTPKRTHCDSNELRCTVLIVTSIETKLFHEIIDHQIALQDMEVIHDRLARKSRDPESVRRSKAAVRAAAASLRELIPSRHAGSSFSGSATHD